jgi:hypothetical protein
MAKAKPRVGETAFTHQDDATAPIHTSNPEHMEAHVFGGAPPEDERETVVIGPPAFGSPDVRTLGHSVNPDQNAVSAPKLDSHFEAIVNTRGVMTESDLQEMSKADLVALAENHGIDVNSSMKKDEIIDAIADEYELADDEEEAEGEDAEAAGDEGDEGSSSTRTEATRTETTARSQSGTTS